MTPTYSHLAHANDLEPSVGHAYLRDQAPYHFEADHDPPFHVVSRFEDVVAILKQPDLWGNRDGPGVFYQQGGVLGAADNPDHDRQRRVLRRIFLPTVIARLEPKVAAVVDAMMDEFVPAGRGDFVKEYAFTMPALVIGEMLGVDAADRNRFRDWSTAVVNGLGGGDLDAYMDATADIHAYIDAQVAIRAEQLDAAGGVDALGDTDPVGPVLPEDAISVMYVAHRRGELSHNEIRQLGHQLLVAGHETTTGLMGLMMWRFCQQPELLEQLRADRTLLDVAVEEGLRFDSPVQGLFRTNAAAAALGAGELELAPRSKVQVLFASANRDPARWPEPDTFRLDRDLRDLRQHVAFGWGLHYCIGAPLARLETRLTFDAVLDRMADITLAGEPQLSETFILRGFTSLPLTWRVVA
jgi:cytochrome P450